MSKNVVAKPASAESAARKHRSMLNLRTVNNRTQIRQWTPFGEALRAVVPRTERGWIRESQDIFENKVSRLTVASWCRGDRNPPEWARRTLIRYIHNTRSKQTEKFDHFLAILEKENCTTK